jgi:hypothetical protein
MEVVNDFLETFTSRDEQLRQSTRLFHLAREPHNKVDVSETHVLRRLDPFEIQTLQGTCRCSCKDWSNVRLLLPKPLNEVDQSTELRSLVSDTSFDGVVIFDMEAAKSGSSDVFSDWKRLAPGIHSNLIVCDSIVKLKSCRVYRNSLLSKTYVGSECVVLNCGYISASPAGAGYGQLNISVGPESGGGRALHLTSEHTMIDVCRQLRNSPTTTGKPYAGIELNVLSHACLIRDTATIQNVYLHEQASIQAATSVSNATLLPTASIGNSCTVSNVLLQWNTSIMDHSTITDTLLMEHAHCGPSSIVTSSVLGPDVHASAGEVQASVIGPNTNAHHQSLVIGVLWPMGRGNVGYGANVGSNHTGRLPDQETTAGEGTFWGLSCVIKFPVDLTFAPYSIVAAGTTLPPQRVCMPFSLIVGGQPDTGNEIIPGWVLQSSPYTLARSEKKFATRRKAKRHGFYTGWKIWRPEIIDMCRWARKALEAGANDSVTVQGIGANKLTSRAREIGIRAYTDCIQRYALHGLLSWVLRVTETGKGSLDMKYILYELLGTKAYMAPYVDPSEKVEWPAFPWDRKDLNEWHYQRSLLLEEFPADSNVSTWLEQLLRTLVTLEKDFARRIHKCKHRDDTRGAQTIPGYAQAHVAADKDLVIVESARMAEKVDSAVAEVLGKLSLNARSRL